MRVEREKMRSTVTEFDHISVAVIFTAHVPCHVTHHREGGQSTFLKFQTKICLFTLSLSGRYERTKKTDPWNRRKIALSSLLRL